MAVGDILVDPRFPDFIERYHADPVRFALEVCDKAPRRTLTRTDALKRNLKASR